MKSPKKNEIVIAFQTQKGLKAESRFQVDGELACTWTAGLFLVDEAFMFLLRGMRNSMKKDRHALNANPLQTVHS